MRHNESDFELSARLDNHLTALRSGGHADGAFPAGLAKLCAAAASAGPGEVFVGELAVRLATEPIDVRRPPAARRQWRRPVLAAVVAGAAVAAAVVVAFVMAPAGEGPRPANAAAIVADAQRAADALSAQDPTDFSLVVRHTMWGVGEGETTDRILHRVELRRWVQQPDHWRTELWFFSFDDIGTVEREELVQVHVGDGATTSSYDRGAVEQRPQDAMDSINTSLTMGTVSQQIGGPSIEQVLVSAAECHDPELVGTEDVNGRPAYVIDLRENRCAPDTQPNLHRYEPVRLWIDSESSLAVRWLSKSSSPNTWVVSEIADLDLSPAFSPGTFLFDPPGR